MYTDVFGIEHDGDVYRDARGRRWLVQGLLAYAFTTTPGPKVPHGGAVPVYTLGVLSRER